MPDARPSPDGNAATPEPAATPGPGRSPAQHRRAFRPGAFAGWIVVGALWGLSIASAMSIGVFLMPVALIGTLVMCLGYTRPEGWPGVIGGLGLVGCYLAFLHRHGPGQYCAGTDPASCTELLNPWPFLAGGLVLILACGLVSWRWYTKPFRT